MPLSTQVNLMGMSKDDKARLKTAALAAKSRKMDFYFVAGLIFS